MGRLQSNKSMLNGVNGNSTHGVCSVFFFLHLPVMSQKEENNN